MAEERITVRAQILALESVAQKQKVVRDHAAEKQVKQELREKLKADGRYEDMKPEEFQSLYRKKLRSYADYIDGRYVPEDEEDGAPGLLVSRCLWENELRIGYSVGNREYAQTVTYCTETNCLEKGDDFFVTVDVEHPQTILRQSMYDYREDWEKRKQQGSDDSGCAVMFAVGLFVVMLLYATGILK